MHRITDEYPKKPIKLDVKDKKLLLLLSENSRSPISELAKKVGLRRDTISYRIKRMQNLGVIQGYYPSIDFKRIGYSLYHVFLLIDETDQEKQKDLMVHLINHPNTRSVIEYSDRWDLEVVLIAKNIEEFDSILTDLLAKFSDIIIEKGKLAEINSYHSIMFPYDFYPNLKKPIPKKKEEINYKPDEKDFQILRALTNPNRLSTYEIAKKTDLSPDTIGLRIKKLHKAGIIKRFKIIPNFFLMNYNWHTFAIQMKVFDKKNESKFKTLVEDHPRIIKAVKTLGNWDLLVYITSDNSKHFHETIKQIKNEFSEIIKNYEAWVALKECVFNPVPDVIK